MITIFLQNVNGVPLQVVCNPTELRYSKRFSFDNESINLYISVR